MRWCSSVSMTKRYAVRLVRRMPRNSGIFSAGNALLVRASEDMEVLEFYYSDLARPSSDARFAQKTRSSPRARDQFPCMVHRAPHRTFPAEPRQLLTCRKILESPKEHRGLIESGARMASKVMGAERASSLRPGRDVGQSCSGEEMRELCHWSGLPAGWRNTINW